MSLAPVTMSKVVTVEREDSILDVAKVMREENVGDVIVVEQDGNDVKPIGIITDRDIVMEIVAQALDIEEVTAGDAMSYELVKLTEDMGIKRALDLMRDKGVRRAPVVNQRGNLRGIISVDDLLRLFSSELQTLADIYLAH